MMHDPQHMIPPTEDIFTAQKVYKYIQGLYSNLNICFKQPLMHLTKYPGSICWDMRKMACLGDRTCYKFNLLVIKT